MTAARRWMAVLGLFAVYFAAARLGLGFDALSGLASPVWPPTGISLAALVLFGPELWPAVALAAFAVNLMAGAPVAGAAGIAAGNTLEAAGGAWLLRRAGFSPALERVRDVAALVGLAAGVSTLASALCGAAVVALTQGGSFPQTFWVWWIGDVGGDLVMAPLLLVWVARPRLELRAPRLAELILILVSLAGVSLLVFRTGQGRPYLLFPPILWAGLRFGPRGSASATFVLTALTVAFTFLGIGPFAVGARRGNLIELQMFISVVAVTALFLGAVVAERGEAVRLRDEFLSVASHEMRTPLAALKLRIEALSRAIGKDGEEALITRVAASANQVVRLEKLLDELLDVSRLGAGRFSVDPRPLDLGELAREVVARVKGDADVQVQAEPGLSGAYDPDRIEQVVSNLVANALKHGRPPVRVTVKRCEAGTTLSVADHGDGVPLADRKRIFERFEQAASSSRAGGLGLGLYITRQIVEAHGGTIRVEAGPEGGAMFVVELPAQA